MENTKQQNVQVSCLHCNFVVFSFVVEPSVVMDIDSTYMMQPTEKQVSNPKSKMIFFEHRSQGDLLFFRLCLYKSETLAYYRDRSLNVSILYSV